MAAARAEVRGVGSARERRRARIAAGARTGLARILEAWRDKPSQGGVGAWSVQTLDVSPDGRHARVRLAPFGITTEVGTTEEAWQALRAREGALTQRLAQALGLRRALRLTLLPAETSLLNTSVETSLTSPEASLETSLGTSPG